MSTDMRKCHLEVDGLRGQAKSEQIVSNFAPTWKKEKVAEIWISLPFFRADSSWRNLTNANMLLP
jgi:hypothetical protein